MKPNRSFNYTVADAEALKQLPELDVVSPLNQLGGYEGANNVLRGIKTAACEIQACFPNITGISDIKMGFGRFINELDIKEKRKICVIGPRVAEMLFNKGEYYW